MKSTLKRNILSIGIFIAISFSNHVSAQFEHDHHYDYYPVKDSLVVQKLEEWQDLKFGLLMHWGTYSQWGIVESWSLCPEDYGWCERKMGSDPENYFTYKQEYEALQETFNPTAFDPEKWAKAAADAGMKYMVFTTKHHDGFCMWDTKETDYKITSESCPFHEHEKADITRAVFDAFRKESIWTGAYFSKPDWNTEYYWWPKFPPLDRNVNYDPAAYPERWEKFIDFTHNQIMELMSGYGKVDILWLDGGWVKKRERDEITSRYTNDVEQSNTGFLKEAWVSQDIRMNELVTKARVAQPGLIVVDRAVSGPNQNYLTPENKVPEKAIPYPWESCIISGGGWSWVKPETAHYKSPRESIHMLVDIVSKGGNLLLNIAPGPHGDWHPDAYKLLEEIGNWMKINAEAIYGTRAIAPYKEDNICFTRKNNTIYAIYLAQEDEDRLPGEIIIKSFTASKNSSFKLLGTNGKLKWKQDSDKLHIYIPERLLNKVPGKDAWVIEINGLCF